MIAVLMGKNCIYKIKLPETAIGNYWLTDDKEKKLISIEGINDKWQIKSNNFVKIINQKYVNISENTISIKKDAEIVNVAILKEYNSYCITFNNTNEVFILYCTPTCEKDLFHLDIRGTNEISIGRYYNNTSISYNNDFVNNMHAKIIKNSDKWYIENYDKKIGTFVNNVPILNEKKLLNNGDMIFIMGLKIIVMDNSIFINNPLKQVNLDMNCFSVNTYKPIINNVMDKEIEEYVENDYFSRAPRINNIIECEKVKIDAPPQMPSKDEMPAILILGPTLSMGIMMIISMFSSISGIVNGNATVQDTITTLLIALIMLVAMVLFPILTRRYEKKQKLKYEKERYQKYVKYINSRITHINEIIEKQKTTLYNNYLSAEECEKMILSRSTRLWERKIEDYDFLTVRLGIGNTTLKIDLQYPEESFSMEDDNLVEILNKVANEAKKLDGVPITLQLAEKNILAIIGKDDVELNKYAKGIIMQMIAMHNYEDLKLIFFIKDNKNWEELRMLPHLWDNIRQIRFFANKYDDMREISKYLEEIFQDRMQYVDEADYRSFDSYYLIITDDYKTVENLKIIIDILKIKTNIGFGLLCIDNNMSQLPSECKTFINIDNGNGVVFNNEISVSSKKDGHMQFNYRLEDKLKFVEICKNLFNIPIRMSQSTVQSLPNSYTFLEMYDAGNIEQLNILDRWNKNDSTLSLRAPIGIDSTGIPIVLDIHEKFHGPHGLIAGATGSGKSEFIITYILSLAINYHPDDLTFLLIDYKGGGLAGAFAKKDIRLPHLVGTITNIDTIGLQRSLDSIQSELRRRQIIFNKAREKTDESTIDIYKYQKLYHEGLVDEPISHLLIICDEFAELKQQQPDFMDELMSVSRIGRSLGVHLILATQKPAGIVNDQIRSNSKFGICLKVQAKEDSIDVIQRPDGANLKNPGQFYMQVGNNEYFALGQSGWTGAAYVPSDTIKKKIDNSIEFVSDIGTVIKKVDNQIKNNNNDIGDQLTNTVKYICELAKKENINKNQLWLDAIPENIYIKDLRKKYNVKDKKNIISPVIGEYDDPFNQCQGVVTLNLSKEGNTIIFGNADSGKETLLSTIVYDSMLNHTSEEVQFYILDFGSEALKAFKDSPSVGDVVFLNDTEKVNRLFDMLQKEIKNRKSVLSEYNGDYDLYTKEKQDSMPMLVIIINNYEAFAENYEDEYEDILQMLTREGTKCGIKFIITASAYADIRYRLAQNFKQTLALQLNNEDDYSNIFYNVNKKRPSHIFGRGLVNLLDEEVYEFQTAKICTPSEWNMHVKQVVQELKDKYKVSAKPIPVIPNMVSIENVKNELKNISKVPIGISNKTLNVITYDFKKNFVSIISAKNLEDTIEFITNILEEIKLLDNVKINLIDAEKIVIDTKYNISDMYKNLNKEIKKKNQTDNEHILYVIIGIDKFANDISEEELTKTLDKAQQNKNCSFIIADNATRIKNHEYDEWYKTYISNDKGIWVGNGVEDQYLIAIDTSGKEIINNCGNSYGYVIENGLSTLVKLLGIKGKGDENE